MIDLIVTRHKALVAYLIEIGLADKTTPVVSHVTDPDMLTGKVVCGVLPLPLAYRAGAVITVPLALEYADRGHELSLERLREIAGRPEATVTMSASAYCGWLSAEGYHPELSPAFRACEALDGLI